MLRPGRWRWLRAIGWMIALFVLVGMATTGVQLGFPKVLGTPPWIGPLGGLAAAVAAYALYVLAVRFGEKRRVSELAPVFAPKELVLGVLIGAGMFAAVFASLRLAGLYTLTGPRASNIGFDAAIALAAGALEELLIRAVIFRLLARAFGVGWALVASAALFGALHLANPNATLFAAAAIAIEAGLMLAAFYVLTRRLWMSIGVHTAWNFMQGPIFGARVSGRSPASSLFTSAPVPGGTDLLTGGAFGPEASLSAIVAGLAIFVIVLAAARRRGIS